VTDAAAARAVGGFRPETYKDPGLVASLSARIAELAAEIGRPVKIMHICGTHEHEIGRYALRDLLPESVTVLAGPGCPCACATTSTSTWRSSCR
jgi:hydrogenase expression/formation protein HypD